jgi:hypothetical protein
VTTEHVQRQDENDYNELRKRYRRDALISLRRREGLSVPIDTPAGPVRFDAQGKAHAIAIGRKRLYGVEIADSMWDGGAPFEILEVSADHIPITQELADLVRDAKLFEKAEKVKFNDPN